MGAFLTHNLDRATLLTKEFFRTHRDAIVSLSEGVKLWEGEGSEALKTFRNYVKSNWFIVVTNTQLVERWVKDSNECTHSGKEEHIASLIAMCRSATVFEYKYQAKEAAKTRALRGNRYLSAGMIGDRIVKKTGEFESNTNKISDVRGAHYAAIVISNTIERSKLLELMQIKNSERLKIRKQLTSRVDQLRTKRTEHTVESYAQSAYSTTQPKPYNSMQRQTGYNVTNHMLGEVPYSSLRIIHIEYIREELSLRRVTFDSKWSIKKLSSALKKYDIELQKQEIIRKTGNTMPKESEINTKSFLPIRRKAEDFHINQ